MSYFYRRRNLFLAWYTTTLKGDSISTSRFDDDENHTTNQHRSYFAWYYFTIAIYSGFYIPAEINNAAAPRLKMQLSSTQQHHPFTPSFLSSPLVLELVEIQFFNIPSKRTRTQKVESQKNPLSNVKCSRRGLLGERKKESLDGRVLHSIVIIIAKL